MLEFNWLMPYATSAFPDDFLADFACEGSARPKLDAPNPKGSAGSSGAFRPLR